MVQGTPVRHPGPSTALAKGSAWCVRGCGEQAPRECSFSGTGAPNEARGAGDGRGVAARSRRFGFLPPVLHGATLPARAELGQNAQDYYGQLV